MGSTDSPEISVRNYYSTKRNILQEHRSHMIIWWYRPWVGPAWHSSKQSGLARSGSAFQTQI